MKIKWQTIWTVCDKTAKKEISEHKTEREALERVRELYEEFPKGKWDYSQSHKIYF
jgi:predicted  nucleic acid-binding Zn ribbon protein